MKNDKTGFLNEMASRDGFALWNKALTTTSKASAVVSFARDANGSDTIIYIPLIQENANNVNAFILARLNDSIVLSLHRANDYASYGFGTLQDATSNAEKLAVQFMILDLETFGHKEFKLLDDRLLKDATLPAGTLTKDRKVHIEHTASNHQNIGNVQGAGEIEICTYTSYWECSSQGNCCVSSGVPLGSCSFCVDFNCWKTRTTCVKTTLSPPVVDLPPGGGGSTGGGGSSSTPPTDSVQCNLTPLINNGLLPCPRGNTTGWMPVLQPVYNPYEANTVILDTSITNNFPCVAKIIDSLANYSNVNALAQTALNEVFNVQKKFHLSFKAMHSWGKNDDDGDTKPDSSTENGINFYSTIRLNSWVLKNSTQEYIAATIIHESIHAYINFKLNQVNNGILDTITFKNLFPLYWPPKNYGSSSNPFYSAGNNSQHNAMAANLISIMASPLKIMYPNPNISSSLRDSIYNYLSWGGLQATASYIANPDTLSIKAFNMISRDTSIYAPFTLDANPKIFIHDSHTSKMKKGCH